MDRKSYNKHEDELFDLVAELRSVFIRNNQEAWFSVNIIINEERRLKVHFDYTDGGESDYGPNDRIKYFQYKVMGSLELNESNKSLLLSMEDYEKREK